MKSMVFPSIVVFCTSVLLAATPKVFLKGGDVWSQEGRKEIQISHTGGKVEALNLSPSGRFVAANHRIGEFEGHDDTLKEGQHGPMEPIYSVLIIDLKSKKVLADLKAPAAFTKPIGWEGNKYRFGEGGELEVYAVHEYDPVMNKTRPLVFNNDSGKWE
ncbi:MAG: hypothetical protein ACT4O3_09665 [Elusimicrobiota bacterium]